MEIIRNPEKLNIEGSSVAIGKFDGIHKGHQVLIKDICKDAVPVVLSFENGRLLPENEENRIFDAMGVKYLIRCKLTEDIRMLEPEEFVKKILVDRLHISKLVCGPDFRFGKDRKGDTDTLRFLSKKYGFTLKVFDNCMCENEKISSSNIRPLLLKGEVSKVRELLGHPYMISGEVVFGRKIGRTLDFPTINIIPDEKIILPPCGVYYTKVEICGIIYDGVTNVGHNPTVTDEGKISVETHILGEKGDFYGEFVKVYFYEFVRPEKKFKSLEDLRRQIREDVNGYRVNT